VTDVPVSLFVDDVDPVHARVVEALDFDPRRPG
jgi:hypothetical protein